jgi:hypothetical protein
MLRSCGPRPMASCSKAPWGLFVLLWVGGVLTAIAVSPSPWLRHCPDRDAFRAGRNLPDKEFRYLRTVIVTAAVHRGFGSQLSPLPLTFRHWAGISPYTSSYDLSRDLWFCYPVAWAALLRLPARSRSVCGHGQEHPFYQRYGVKLPSSLTRDHSSTLAYSASLPVSVCGTGTPPPPEPAFLDCPGAAPLRWVLPPPLALASRSTPPGLTGGSLPAWTALISPRSLPLSIRPW